MTQTQLSQVLLNAVINNQYEAAQALLEAGAGKTWPNKGVDILLHAIANNNQSMALLLLEHGASFTAKNEAGESPIIVAASQKKWDFVKFATQDLNQRDVTVLTNVLFMAIEDNDNDNEAIISMLLQLGVDLSVRDIKNSTGQNKSALELAAKLKKWNIVKQIASNIASIPNPGFEIINSTASVLFLAVIDTEFESIKLLLDILASPAFTCVQTAKAFVLAHKMLALRVAVSDNNFDFVNLLIEHDAELIRLADEKHAIIDMASELRQWEMVTFLAKKLAAHDKEEAENKDKIEACKREQHELDQLDKINGNITALRNARLNIQGKLGNNRNQNFIPDQEVIRDSFGKALSAIKAFLSSPNTASDPIYLQIFYKAEQLCPVNYSYAVTSPVTARESKQTQQKISEILELCEHKTPLTVTIANLLIEVQANLSYLERVRSLLIEMQREITNTTWTTTFLGKKSTNHYPKHIGQISYILNYPVDSRRRELDEVFSGSLIYAFNNIKHILFSIEPKKRRDPATQAFYDKYRHRMQLLSFDTPIDENKKEVDSNAMPAQTQKPSGISAPIHIPVIQKLSPEDNIGVEKIYPTLDFESVFLTTATDMPAVSDIPDFSPPTYAEHMQRTAHEAKITNAEQFPAPSAPIEETTAPIAASPQQSTAIIFNTVGLPSNEAQIEKTDEIKIESEEEKRVRLTKEALATMPELPKTQLRVFDRKAPRPIGSNKEPAKRSRQMALAT